MARRRLNLEEAVLALGPFLQGIHSDTQITLASYGAGTTGSFQLVHRTHDGWADRLDRRPSTTCEMPS